MDAVTWRLSTRTPEDAIEAPNSVMTWGLFGYIIYLKVSFSKRFSAPIAFPAMIFDSAFIDHWKQRWEFLRQHMKLSVETIAAQQDLLLTSLPDRLAPRWQLLSSIASEQADFKAEDHLIALATLSDQDFADFVTTHGELLFLNKVVGLLLSVVIYGGCVRVSVSKCFVSLRCMAGQAQTCAWSDSCLSSVDWKFMIGIMHAAVLWLLLVVHALWNNTYSRTAWKHTGSHHQLADCFLAI